MREKKLAMKNLSVIVDYNTTSLKGRWRPGTSKMFKTTLQINDYVSLAVLLLMVVALVAGQADASVYSAELRKAVSPVAAMDDRININFDGQLGDAALKVSIAVATDLSQFRGENE
jgi:hypothetical protein